MDRDLLAYFLQVRRDGAAGAGGHGPARVGHRAGLFLTRVIERLPDVPATLFSGAGEVLRQTRSAVALFGDYTRGPSSNLVDRWLTDPAARDRYLVEVGAPGPDRRRRYRHAGLGELELYRLLLIDPVSHELLLVFTAVPGSPSDEKLRRR